MTALLRAAGGRRFRRGRAAADWRKRMTAVALLAATAVAALLAFAVPYPLIIASLFPPVSLSAFVANSSFGGPLLYSTPYPPPPPPPSLPLALPVRAASDLPSNPTNSTLETSYPPPPFLASPSPTIRNSDSRGVKSSGGGMMAGALRRETPYWRMSPDEQLRYAKREIGNAPLVSDDPDLYGLIFWNVSVFKRSYELMESILKVYIYQDGRRPIFHTPELQGIYASEGWFMKLIKENKKYVVKDPSKAHLFYLPYSSRQLELALYEPGSHNLRPLSLFLRDYVNTIAAKYPFWNRTRGADHFLVACHDWGPYTTTAHDDLRKNTIKALCNADVSEGIFVRGRDVSLPETTIRTPRKPLRYVGGGRRVSQRPILAFFAGNMHGRVRPILLKHWGDKDDDDMRIYSLLPARVSKKMNYIQHMKASRYCICPMGYEVNSPRIVEAIYYECVPVIIADNFVLPFDEVLNWSAFSVVVAERDIPDLKNILLGIPVRRYLSLLACGKMLQKHFLWHDKPLKYDLFHMILHSIWFNRLNQIQVQQ